MGYEIYIWGLYYIKAGIYMMGILPYRTVTQFKSEYRPDGTWIKCQHIQKVTKLSHKYRICRQEKFQYLKQHKIIPQTILY